MSIEPLIRVMQRIVNPIQWAHQHDKYKFSVYLMQGQDHLSDKVLQGASRDTGGLPQPGGEPECLSHSRLYSCQNHSSATTIFQANDEQPGNHHVMAANVAQWLCRIPTY